MTPHAAPRLPREAGATLRLAGPLIGAQIAHIGLSFIDTVMAGQLGAHALAAVAVGANVFSPLFLLLLGVLMAVPTAVAQLDGAGRREGIGSYAHQALWTGLGVAVPVILFATHLRPLLTGMGIGSDLVPTVEGYLEALCWGLPALALYLVLRFVTEGLGDVRPILAIGLLGLPVNALGNWVLMYGKLGMPALGAVGCGYATSLVWGSQALAMALYMLLQPTYRRLGLFARLETPRLARILEVLRLGLPIGIALFFELSMFAVVALVLGSLGTATVAGHQVALNFAALTFMVPLGISLAITVRVGNALGRGDPAAVRRAALVGITLAMTAQAVSATIILVAPRWVAGFYTSDPAVTAVAVELLFLAALFQLSDGLQVSAAGALRGLGDTRVLMLITAVAYWGVGLPAGYLLTFPGGLGARGMWIGLVAGLTLAALLLNLRLLAVFRRVGTEREE